MSDKEEIQKDREDMEVVDSDNRVIWKVIKKGISTGQTNQEGKGQWFSSSNWTVLCF